MTDITGGDVEIIARRMSAERLAVKRAHAARHPEGRTAELVAHIEAQEETIREARQLIAGLLTGLDEFWETDEVVGVPTVKWAHEWLAKQAAHKEE